MPKVSVIIPSYNHARFIGEAISSVLNQTFTDYELIVSDDGSSDHSIDVIKSFHDPRMTVYVSEKNRGAVLNVNDCIRKAKGEYIALLNSDDSWDMDKLRIQVDYLDNHPDCGIVFSNVKFINEEKRELSKSEFFWNDVFTQPNRSRSEWLRFFFYNINCLCHPSMLIRKKIYDLTGLYKFSLRQLPDFDMWVSAIKYTDIHILPEKLVNFTILKNNQNSSSDSAVNRVRNRNEIYLIMRNIFDNISDDMFISAFSDKLVKKTPLTKEQVKCEKALIYFTNETEISYIYKLIGIEKLHELFCDDRMREVLITEYNYSDRDYFAKTGELKIIDAKTAGLKSFIIANTLGRIDKQSKLYCYLNIIKSYLKK